MEHKPSYQLCVSGYDQGSDCPLSISHSLYKNYPRISEYLKNGHVYLYNNWLPHFKAAYPFRVWIIWKSYNLLCL